MGVGVDVDHRGGGAGLEAGDQFKQEGGGGFGVGREGLLALGVAGEIALGGDAAYVETGVGLGLGQVLEDEFVGGIPAGIEGEDAGDDVMGTLGRGAGPAVGMGRLVRWRLRTLRVRSWAARAVSPVNSCLASRTA